MINQCLHLEVVQNVAGQGTAIVKIWFLLFNLFKCLYRFGVFCRSKMLMLLDQGLYDEEDFTVGGTNKGDSDSDNATL